MSPTEFLKCFAQGFVIGFFGVIFLFILWSLTDTVLTAIEMSL